MYLDNEQKLSIIKDNQLRKHLDCNYNYIENSLPTRHTLVYGQVQSGKTNKIIQYVKGYKPNLVKIIIIQNSLSMLAQYKNAFENANITYVEMSTRNIHSIYNNENAILVMNNKYRKNAMVKYLDKNNIIHYSLVLDESDQYYKQNKDTRLFNNANYCLHVTATPLKLSNLVVFEKIIRIHPKNNYFGINDIDIKNIMISNCNIVVSNVIEEDFLNKPHGFMLINALSRISQMNLLAHDISSCYPNIPIIVMSTKTTIWRGGLQTTHKMKSVPHFIDKFNEETHFIVIANRYSNRGINFTNTTYTRNITHQISRVKPSGTTSEENYIQKCRIFGNRNIRPNYKPTLYNICNPNHVRGIIMNVMLYMNEVNSL